MTMKAFTIGPNDAGQRLDKFLHKAVPRLPAPLMHKYMRLKRVKLNGARCEAAQRLAPGDRLELYINDEFFEQQGPAGFLDAPGDVKIVYEDENILLADKPAGMLTHEDANESRDTLINRILRYLYDKGEYVPENERSFAPALCNRLDRNTRGIVIAAKNAEALRLMNEKIKNREVTKLYLCLAYGSFAKKENTLKGWHVKDGATNTVRIHPEPVPGAKTALTKYKVLQEREGISLLEIELLTGRTHQIRAHLAAIGHPLVGDLKYGVNRMNKNTAMAYQALCSYKLVFDFKTGAGILGYLKGRAFELGAVGFAEDFRKGWLR
jgi:23S rRNA pseudouridine955/2504/2580 synthase